MRNALIFIFQLVPRPSHMMPRSPHLSVPGLLLHAGALSLPLHHLHDGASLVPIMLCIALIIILYWLNLVEATVVHPVVPVAPPFKQLTSHH